MRPTARSPILALSIFELLPPSPCESPALEMKCCPPPTRRYGELIEWTSVRRSVP
jgi:hypothetical protein